MVMKLYKLDGSPPARAVMMVCDILKVPVEMVDVNLITGEHLTPEYLKLNPMHTVPVLEDGNFVLHDSHAILTYLAEKYGNNQIYPNDIQEKALVDQKLYLNSSILFQRVRNITYPLIIQGGKSIPEQSKNDIYEAFGFLETFLSKTKYLAGDRMTVADIAAFASVTSHQQLVPFDGSKYPKLNAWVAEIEKQPFAQKMNKPGLTAFKALVDKALSK